MLIFNRFFVVVVGLLHDATPSKRRSQIIHNRPVVLYQFSFARIVDHSFLRLLHLPNIFISMERNIFYALYYGGHTCTTITKITEIGNKWPMAYGSYILDIDVD